MDVCYSNFLNFKFPIQNEFSQFLPPCCVTNDFTTFRYTARNLSSRQLNRYSRPATIGNGPLKNIVNGRREGDEKGKESVFRARTCSSGSLLCPRNFCSQRAHASRSDRHVLRRFLPVRFETCLNDAPRLPSIQRVEAMGYFQGNERRAKKDVER